MKLKKLLLFLIGITLSVLNNTAKAQVEDMNDKQYEKQWQEIEKLLNESRLPKSALKQINSVWDKAIKENNEPQQIKALIYWSKATLQVAENTKDTLLPVWLNNIHKVKGVQKAILQSILGEMVWNYYENNRWNIKDRTATQDFMLDDLATWAPADFEKEVSQLYLASIENSAELLVPLDKYKVIFEKGNKAIDLRPTVFDILAQRAVNHFTNTRTQISTPVNPFRLIDTALFEPVEIFVTHKFLTTDSTSSDFKIIGVLKNWLTLHLKDKDPSALIDADLLRLDYAYQNTPLKFKRRYYRVALEKLSDKYLNHPAWAEFQYRLAQLLIESGNEWDGKTEKNKWDLKNAYQLLQNASAKYPDSYGGQLSKLLMTQLATSSLNIQIESVNIPGKPILSLVNYKNLDKLHFRIIKSDDNVRKAIDEFIRKGSDDAVYDYLRKLKYVQSDVQNLKDPGDFREHSVEFMIGSLPYGEYIILFSSDESYRIGFKQVLGYTNFTVSQLSIALDQSLPQAKIIVTDRVTGKPLKGVRIKITELRNEYQKSEYKIVEKVLFDKLLTDVNGIVTAELSRKNNQYNVSWKIEAFTKSDYFNVLTSGRYYYNTSDNKPYQKTIFYTDRSIYRPGQTIYFKAILVQKNNRSSSIITNKQVTIGFYDTNGKKLDEKKFTTNDFGTISGNFVAPLSGLRGQMRLQSDQDGVEWISVEEYKRPTFEVKFDKIEGEFALGDNVSVTGTARAFAGNALNFSKVNYRVVRKTAFPYWDFYRFLPSNVATQEIINGTSITDEAGKFKIDFRLLPDDDDDVSRKPIYTYEVSVDISDQAGETRTGTTSLRAGYTSVELSVDIPETVEQKDNLTTRIKTNNLNGVEIKVPYSIEIASLRGPGFIIKKKYWQQPEYQLIPEDKYRTAFPGLAYAHEDDYSTWPTSKQVYNQSFVSSIDSFLINTSDWEPGIYRFTVQLKDNTGNPLIIKKYFRILSKTNKENIFELGPEITTDKEKYEPGETALISINSPGISYHIWYEVIRGKDISEAKWINVKDKLELKIPVKESDRGNLDVRFYTVNSNRKFDIVKSIKVPWTNKELKIEYLSFRDKLLPGQNETWKIKISGSNKEKVVAELTASMYDASLDYFKPHNWSGSFFDSYSSYIKNIEFYGFDYRMGSGIIRYEEGIYPEREYPYLNMFGYYPSLADGRGGRLYARSDVMYESAQAAKPMATESVKMKRQSAPEGNAGNIAADQGLTPPMTEEKKTELKDIPVRQNLKETVFFIPKVQTDPDGNYILEFQMNEALTSWKLQLFAHTKELAYVFDSKIIKTQKELMIQPNMPRFLRQGDTISLSARISNLSSKDLMGVANINLVDGQTGQDITRLFAKVQKTDYSVKKGQNTSVSWSIIVPNDWVSPIEYKVIAQSGELSDGEGGILPVLADRMLVIETMPLPVRAGQTKTFTLRSLKENQSKTLQHFNYTLEFTPNPVWYAVKALPYLSEYPFECSEQLFSRIYANVIASYVANKNPKYKEIYDKWKAEGNLKSKLSLNQELKYTMLKETPWVRDAAGEEDQMEKMANLFDMMRIKDETTSAIKKLSDNQLQDGGFPWFAGGYPDWFITQYIVAGFEHLKKLNLLAESNEYNTMISKSKEFIDYRFLEDYKNLKRLVNEGKAKWEDDHLSHIIVHYLYTNSFDKTKKWEGDLKTARDYYLGQIKKYWVNRSIYEQGFMSLVLNRMSTQKDALVIVKSLTERAIYSDELGMYWKSDWGYYWYQMPVETQSLMIEVYDEVAKDSKAVDELRVWLIKNKQTNSWRTTKATADAIYALLLTGSDWVSETLDPGIKVGNKQLDVKSLPKEPGTGYFKTSYKKEEINNDLATVTVSNPNKQIAFGAVYWQYFEKLENIKSFKETPLTIKKDYFRVENSPGGPIMKPVSNSNQLEKGDKVRVRVEIKVDRDMEYVHLKDMRGSGFEPVNTISHYQYKGGLGYYESTRDAATDFFISYLPKGTYVFEYDLRANATGSFSMGISTMQCMYAPEFSSHSKGERLRIK